MDPNETLREIREITHNFFEHGEDEELAVDFMPRLSELITELDHWIITGGFLPNAWEKKDNAR